MYLLKKYNQHQRILCLTILCICIPISTLIFQKSSAQTTVYQGLQKFHVIKKDNQIYAFDCGALGARPSSQSWIEYTLTPTMIKNLGATHIDVLVLCKSNSRTDAATKILMELIPVYSIVHIS